ncbi:MAG: hypothetical protein HYV09_11925 [Deltaproteobacteria bacterium]|nr:hypothetical protein [Deltaproteobacteria bacterium]
MRCLVLTLALTMTACGAGKPRSAAVQPSVIATPIADPKARAALDEGERIVDVAGSDCAAACAGLAKMVRARVQLCSPRTTSCEDAERREGKARTHVAAFCECPP